MKNFPLALANGSNYKESCEGLFSVYSERKSQIQYLADLCQDSGSIVAYFAKGNFPNDHFRASSMFDIRGALKALNAEFWQKAMSLTGVLDLMPAKLKNEWYVKIEQLDTPEFEPLTVISTIEDLLLSRKDFFTDKVEGVFNSMSDTHVTNSPSGFTKRFILNGVLDTRYGYSPNHYRVEVLEDLREVVCQVNNLSRPTNRMMYSLIYDVCKNKSFGEWIEFDGGKFKVKFFKAGTAHVEIEHETALKLNMVLAHRYPQAIPSKFRTASKVKDKKIDGAIKLISSQTASVIYDYYLKAENGKAYYGNMSDEALEVLVILGAELEKGSYPKFDKVPTKALQEVFRTRVIPDVKKNQYYPTKAELASIMVEMAEINEGDSVLEPSAGQGGIATVVSNNVKNIHLELVEIDKINCAVLEDKGFSPVHLDFLDYSTKNKFDKVIMNPPFSEGRAKNHVLKALEHLKVDGTLVACLPATFKNSVIDETFDHEYSEVFEDQFENTKVRVVLVKMTKAKY